MNLLDGHQRNVLPLCLAVLMVWVLGVRESHGQAKLEEGEEVKVLFLNQWQDGVVLGSNKSLYGVEFEFAGARKREMFNRANIRKLCEIDAMDLARTWESSNGKFKIEAALKTYAGEKVVLAKTDGNEIEVPINSLGPKDLAYLKKFKKNLDQAVEKGMVPMPVPKLPPIESFDGGVQSLAGIIVGEGRVQPLGSVPAFLTEFQQSGTGFYFARDKQELVAVIPVGGPEQLVLLTAREDNFTNQGVEFQSQAYWVSLKQQKVIGTIALPPEDHIVDYDPRSKRLLSIHRNRLGQNQDTESITLWNLKPGDTQAEPVVRWEVQFAPQIRDLFCKIINPELVLAKTEPQTYKVWNTVTKQVAYTFKTASFFDASIVLSPDRKILLLPEDGKVTVLDAESGALKFSLKVDDRHVSGVNIDQRGTRLACLTERNIYVWDLAKSDPSPKVYAAPLIGSPFESRIEWVDDDLVLAASQQQRVLYRLSLELPVWSYRMDVADVWLNQNPLTNQVLNGLFFYVAEPDKFKGSIAIGAAKLPGPKVDELTKSLNRESLMLMKPGVRVRLQLGSLTDPSAVDAWLTDKIRANGWILDPNAPIALFAEMGQGQTKTETYQEMGLGAKTTSVTFTPHYANLTLKQEDIVIWQTGTTTGAPSMVRAVDLQSEVAKSQVPQLDFFRVVSIPSQIIDPKYSRGFGVSQLGLKGIEVLSTSPPGRETEQATNDSSKPNDGR